jgi:hypothetical protein
MMIIIIIISLKYIIVLSRLSSHLLSALSIAAYALEQTYTLMDHNNAIRLNVTFGDLNLNFYYLRHQPQEI